MSQTIESENNHHCPQCGQQLPEKAPKGLCPGCLMAGALQPTQAFTGTATTPPPIDVVQKAFPQLEILDLIGSGGMGVVYKAKQVSLNRLIALKLLAPHCVDEPGFAERFTREAQALASMNHANIITIHDFGESDGFYYLMMEFVDGVNLRQIMKLGKFTPEQALAVVPSICDALQYAHEHGIVHRDIKPENLLIDQSGKVQVADFGIARILNRAEPTELNPDEDPTELDLTLGTALGTPSYMSPEQANAPKDVDHRSDIYSLGVVFYEMLTGERPGNLLKPPSSKVQMDIRLDEVVLRALADQPENRWQNAGEFKTQVETIATTPSVSLAKLPETAQPRNRKALASFILGVFTALIAFAIPVYLYIQSQQEKPSQDPAVALFEHYTTPVTPDSKANLLTSVPPDSVSASIDYYEPYKRNRKEHRDAMSPRKMEEAPHKITSIESGKPTQTHQFPAPKKSDPPLMNTREVIAAFLDAPDWESRIPWIYQADKIQSKMSIYYNDNPDFRFADYPILDYRVKLFQMELDSKYGGPFWVFQLSVNNKEESGVPIIIRVEDGNLKVDWQAFVEFYDRHFLRFKDGKMEYPANLRLIANQVNFPKPNALKASVTDDYLCYELNPPYGGYRQHTEYSFVKKGTPLASKMDSMISMGEDPLALTIKLNRKKLSDGNSYYIIEDFITEGWFTN